MLSGSSKYLDLPQNTVIAVCQEFDKSKQTKIKQIVKGNISGSSFNFIGFRGRKSRPWVPLKGASIKFDHSRGELIFNKRRFQFNIDRVIDGEIRDAKMVQEADGWYCCVSLKQAGYGHKLKNKGNEIGGVDFGLKTFATRSDGFKLDKPDDNVKVFGKIASLEDTISRLKSQRDRLKNKKLLNSKFNFLEKKIKKLEKHGVELRKNFHFNAAYAMLDGYSELYVGDLGGKFIQSSAGVKSKKYSIGLMKTRLEWIAKKTGKKVIFVDERNTTNTCSTCLEKTGPVGLGDLNIRDWTCTGCGSKHDRDVNAAKNMILAGQGQRDEKLSVAVGD